MIICEILKFSWRPSQTYPSSLHRNPVKTVFSVPRGLLSFNISNVPPDGDILESIFLFHKPDVLTFYVLNCLQRERERERETERERERETERERERERVETWPKGSNCINTFANLLNLAIFYDNTHEIYAYLSVSFQRAAQSVQPLRNSLTNAYQTTAWRCFQLFLSI